MYLDLKNWMAALSDDLLLSEVSLAGYARQRDAVCLFFRYGALSTRAFTTS